MLEALAIAAIVVALASLGYACAVAVVVIATNRGAPRLERWRRGTPPAPAATPTEAEQGPQSPAPMASMRRISVIIPAHDEERVIDDCLRSIRNSVFSVDNGEPGIDLEIIVVADRCGDRTEAIVAAHAAEDPRVRLIIKSALPPAGWTGKCHAGWTGFGHARGDWLLFTDADTYFAPDLIATCHAVMCERRLDLFSLVGHLGREHDFERMAQPLAAMTLMRMYPLRRANRSDPAGRRPFANGQFLMFRRACYEAVGGHEAVRHAILEDLRFAVRLNNREYSIGVGLAESMFLVRMYATRAAFRKGWKRIFTEGANRHVPRLRSAAWRLRCLAVGPLLLIAGLILGLSMLVVGDQAGLGQAAAGLSVLALAANAVAFGWIYRLQGARWTSIIHLPRGAWQVADLIDEAASDLKHLRGMDWADLHYEVQPQDEARSARRSRGEKEARQSSSSAVASRRQSKKAST